MAGADLSFGCTCGKVHGTLRDVSPKSGTALQCQCDDCRRAIIWLGQPDPGPDGVRYFQTTPDRTRIDASALQAFTWKNGKLLRWYAPCCNTPLFNTLNSPKWAFASILIDTVATPDALGEIKARAFIPKANGKRGHDGMATFMFGFLKRVTAARLGGSWRQTPFFDDTGTPRAPVQHLTQTDRASAQLP